MLALVRNFRNTPDASFSGEFLLHFPYTCDASFSEEFHTPVDTFSEELLLHS